MQVLRSLHTGAGSNAHAVVFVLAIDPHSDSPNCSFDIVDERLGMLRTSTAHVRIARMSVVCKLDASIPSIHLPHSSFPLALSAP